jgi:tetratricopeptide (TPR) repeat protein
MMFCTQCGKAIQATDRFCKHCGSLNGLYHPDDPAPSDLDRDQGRALDLSEAEAAVRPAPGGGNAPAGKRRWRKRMSARQVSGTQAGDGESKPEQKMVPPMKKKKPNFKVIAVVAVLILVAAAAGGLFLWLQNNQYEHAMRAGDSYLDAAKYKNARASYAEASRIKPRRPDGYEGQAAADLGLGRYPNAKKQLKAAAEHESTTYGKALWAALDARTNRKRAAASKLNQVAKADDIRRRAGVAAGDAAKRLGKYNTGIKIVNKALKNVTSKKDKKYLYDTLIDLYVAADKSNDAISALLDRAAKATGDMSYIERRETLLVGKPVFKDASGTFNAGFKLSIKAGKSGETIYYTTNGDAPTKASARYTGAIVLPPENTTVVRAVEYNSSGRKSRTVKGVYTIRALSAPKAQAWKDVEDANGMDAKSFSWNKVSGATGYDTSITLLQPGTSKAVQGESREADSTAVTVTTSDAGYMLKGRVRAYIEINGTRYYSAWSNEVSVDNGYEAALSHP